jgi:hypothetical protein
MPNIVIDVAAEFTGKRAFEQAGKSTNNLEKNVKKLAKTFGVAFGATAVANFAKASAKAFIEDENAARSLSVTIKNLGLAYGNNAVIVSDFINNLEKQTGVLDDELRPAMDRLLRATGSVSKSQELLNLSLDIAAGTGKTVTQVSQSLQKAYLGQTAAIGRLGVGISKAELATGQFADIQEKLTKLFSGQSAAAANSYAGQLAKLQVAANNAKETIGKGLVDALKLLASDKSIDDLNEGLEKTSQYIADIILGVGVFIQKLKDIPIAGKAFQLPLDAYIQAIPVLGTYISLLADLGKEQRTSGLTTLPISPYYLKKQAEAAAKAAKAAEAARIAEEKRAKAAAAAKLAAEKKANAAAKIAADKRAAADKKAAAQKAILAKADSMFNIERIQIEAALKGRISADEKLRLELQRAILNEDFELADKLQKKLEASQRATAALQGQINTIKPPANPFAETLSTLELIAELLGKVSGLSVRKPGGVLALEPDDLLVIPPTTNVNPSLTPTPTITDPVPVVVIPSPTPTPMPQTNGSMAGLGGGVGTGAFYGQELPSYMRSSPVTVNVTVTGSVIAQQDLVKVVNDAVVEANTQGLSTVRPGGLGFRVDEG